MKKFLIRSFIVVVIFYVVLLISYQFDEELSPEIIDILSTKYDAIKPKDNANYQLIGFYSDEKTEPVKKAKDIIEYARSYLQTGTGVEVFIDSIPSVVELPMSQSYDEIRDLKVSSFLNFIIKKPKQTTSILNDNRILLDRYKKLYQFEQFVENEYVFGSIDIIKFNKVVLLDITREWKNGQRHKALDTLSKDIKFWRKVYGSDVHLFTKMISIAILASDMELVSVFISDCSGCEGLNSLLHTDLKEFSQDEMSLRLSMHREFRFIYKTNYYNIIKPEKDNSGLMLARRIYKHNSSMNHIYENIKDSIAFSECKFYEIEECLVKYNHIHEDAKEYEVIHFLKNPLAYFLVESDFGMSPDYAKTSFAMELYRRLLHIKYMILSENIVKNEIPNFLSRLEPTYLTPVENKEVTYDKKNHTLDFQIFGNMDFELEL